MNKIIMFALLTFLLTTVNASFRGHVFWGHPGDTLSRDQINNFGGCYARLHMDKSHNFRILNIMGTAAFPDIDHIMGADIEHDINFIEVGPNATVRLFDNEEFIDYRGSLPPDSTYDDYDRLDMIDSFEVGCL